MALDRLLYPFPSHPFVFHHVHLVVYFIRSEILNLPHREGFDNHLPEFVLVGPVELMKMSGYRLSV